MYASFTFEYKERDRQTDRRGEKITFAQTFIIWFTQVDMDRYDVQQMPFDRLPPKVLDDQVFLDFENYYNRIQEFSGLPNATNRYNILTRNYVAGMYALSLDDTCCCCQNY